MAEPKNNHAETQQQPASPPEKPENPRKAIREARAARLRVIQGPVKTVKVYAANEAMRGVLRHANGTRFRASLDQAAEWPNDSFTARRIAEGSVRTEPSSGGEQAEPDATKNPREHAEALKPKKQEPAPQEKPTQSKPESRSQARSETKPTPEPAA